MYCTSFRRKNAGTYKSAADTLARECGKADGVETRDYPLQCPPACFLLLIPLCEEARGGGQPQCMLHLRVGGRGTHVPGQDGEVADLETGGRMPEHKVYRTVAVYVSAREPLVMPTIKSVREGGKGGGHYSSGEEGNGDSEREH